MRLPSPMLPRQWRPLCTLDRRLVPPAPIGDIGDWGLGTGLATISDGGKPQAFRIGSQDWTSADDANNTL